jgi:hypothetical protein
MARVLLDRTQRTAPQPDARLWKVIGGTSFTEISEAGGWISWQGVATGQARHLVPLHSPWATGQGILCKVTRDVTSASTARHRIWLHHSGTSASTGGEIATNGVCMTIAANSDTTVQKVVASTSSTISTGTVSGKVPVGQSVWVRGESIDGRWRFRMWTDGTTEPGTWDHDIADDGTVPAGVPAVSSLRSGAATIWRTGDISIYAATGSYPTPTRPRVYNRLDGTRIPYGRRSQLRADDVTDATLPAWLTGTATTDTAAGLRTLSAGISATVSLTGPTATGDAHFITVDNVRLSSDTQAGMSLKFTDGTNTWELRQDPTATVASLYAGATATAMPYQIRNNGEGPRHRTLTLGLIPAVSQLIAFEGGWRDGQIIGWIDIASPPTRSTALTPSVSLIAGTSARTMDFTALQIEVQRL